MSNALNRHLKNVTETSATERIPGRKDQVENNTGGFVFTVNDKSRLERFLILGTDGGTFYVEEKKNTLDNVDFLLDLIQRDEKMVAEVIMSVSKENRAKKVDPTLFATAALFAYAENKVLAREVFETTVKGHSSTHLFKYMNFQKALSGFGKGKRKAVASWYEDKSADRQAYDMVKYRGGREGWTHRDVMRVSHAKPNDSVARFALGEDVSMDKNAPDVIKGFYAVQKAGSEKDAVKVLKDYPSLPWETLPTEYHKSVNVWKTLFENGLNGQALVRQITRFARLGMFKDMAFAKEYADRIRKDVPKARIHPIGYLLALNVHTDGQKREGRSRWASYYRDYSTMKDWETSPIIAAALEASFYDAFQYVEPANKRVLVALDISGSMNQPVFGMPELQASQVAAAMAMTFARTEPMTMVRGFSVKETGVRTRWGVNRENALVDLGITAKTNLQTSMRAARKHTMGATNLSMPMMWALENDVPIDAFVMITDNENNSGRIQPAQALTKYRRETGIDARMVVMATSATEFTVADPKDAGSLDVVGFDSAAPGIVTDFIAGRI